MFSGKLKVFLFWCIACSVAMMSPAIAATSQESLAKIDNFLNQGNYQEAYQFAENLSKQAIGDQSFDMLFGRAALAAGKPDVAFFAFDRVIINNPSNDRARFLLAEASYELKMYDRAKTEIQLLISGAHPSVLSSELKELSDKINQDYSEENKSYYIYGRMLFGYDNNASSNTDEDYVKYLDLINFDVNQYTNDQVSDLYSRLRELNGNPKSVYLYPQIGIGGTHTLTSNSKFNLLWNANVSHKEYTEVNGFDASQANLSLGMDYQLNPLYLLNGTFYYQEYMLNGKRYREAPIAAVSLSRVLNSHNNLKIYTNGGIFAYPNNRTSDVYMGLGGLEWLYYDDRNMLVTQTFYGRNQPRGVGAKYYGNDYYGVDIAATRNITQEISVTVGGIYQRSLYDVKQFTDSPRRKDSYRQVTTGVYYHFHPKYTWYVLGAYTNNSSNVFIYKYDRFETWTGISFEF
ncbi:MAG TPA: hypothetical protein DCZ38_02030 [Coxiellaceae bacterium]|nr:hypothetical protein [Coxiellaceae bacterium]